MKGLLGLDAPDLNEWVWTKVGYVGGEMLPNNEVFSDADNNFFRKVSIDGMWELPLEYFIDADFEGKFTDEAEHLMAETTNQDAVWYRDAKLPFAEVLTREKAYRVRRLIDALKKIAQELWDDYPDHRDVSQKPPPTKDDFDPWALPSLQVMAGINAAMIVSGKKFSVNDILDFQHAALAVPYCDALFCDRPMASTLINKPLKFGKVYDTEILSRAEDIAAYLATLLSSELQNESTSAAPSGLG